jgi:hypothetical protein
VTFDTDFILGSGGIVELQTIIDALLARIVALEQGGGGGGGGATTPETLTFAGGSDVAIGPGPGPGTIFSFDLSASDRTEATTWLVAGEILFHTVVPATQIRLGATPLGLGSAIPIAAAANSFFFAFVAVAVAVPGPIGLSAQADTNCTISLDSAYVIPIGH